jgi:hypothetical protein
MLSLVRTLLFLSFLLQGINAQNYAFDDDFRNNLEEGTIQIVGVGNTTTRVFSVTPQFFPLKATRNVGQTISFRFFANSSQEFSVTEGTLGSPCTPKPGGFSSGVIRNPKDLGQTVSTLPAIRLHLLYQDRTNLLFIRGIIYLSLSSSEEIQYANYLLGWGILLLQLYHSFPRSILLLRQHRSMYIWNGRWN